MQTIMTLKNIKLSVNDVPAVPAPRPNGSFSAIGLYLHHLVPRSFVKKGLRIRTGW